MRNCINLSLHWREPRKKALMEIKKFNVGDVLEMKKQHPCGEKRMKVLRIGSDIRLVCMGCGRDMTIAREKLEKNIRKIISSEIV